MLIPIIYFPRVLSRLTVATDPDSSLSYATTALKLGDAGATGIQAHLLDYCNLTTADLMGRERLSTISNLIAKLDPVYAYNSTILKSVKETGFVNQLIGNIFIV